VVLAALDIGLLVIEDLNLNVFGIAFKEVGVQCEVEDGAGDIGRARLHVIVRQPRRLGPWSPEVVYLYRERRRPSGAVLGIVRRGFDGANSRIVVIEALLAT
jgi:hypothetical protein